MAIRTTVASSGGSQYTQYANFAAVPAAGAGNDGVVVLVIAGTWSAFPPKLSGFYRSDGSNWIRLAPYSSHFMDTKAIFYDDGNDTKRAAFQLSGVTAGQTRVMTVPDKNITLVGDNDVSFMVVLGGINAKTVQENTVYTVPSGKVFIPERAMFHCDVLTGAGAAHTAKWEADAGAITDAEQSANTAAHDVDVMDLDSSTAYPATTVFKYEVTGASTHTAHEGNAILKGTLFDA